jgi:hypothetical protein
MLLARRSVRSVERIDAVVGPESTATDSSPTTLWSGA